MITTVIPRILCNSLKTYPKILRFYRNSAVSCTESQAKNLFLIRQQPRTPPLLYSSIGVIKARGFHRPADVEEENNPQDKLASKKIIHNLVPDSARALRLANENGYLSWCRNAYLSCGVAVMMNQLGIADNILLQYAASGALFVSLLNLVGGTTSFIVNLIAQKTSVGMSFPASLLLISFAVLHLLAWSFVVFLLVSYPDNDLLVIEIEKAEEDDL